MCCPGRLIRFRTGQDIVRGSEAAFLLSETERRLRKGMKMEALLIDIQRGSLNDGPGIRTTFFLKGCPLRCSWCHNPESQKAAPQLSFHRERCTLCWRCREICPARVHRMEPDRASHQVDFEDCLKCGACAAVCPANAMKVIGRACTPEEAVEIAVKDREFYEQSGGGVTLSGGEPLTQPDFSAAFLSLCQDEMMHTCMETSGYAGKAAVEKVLPYVDLFYFDWKVSTEELAGEYLGVPLAPILENLKLLCRAGKEVVLRCPIIPGVNDREAHFRKILSLLEEFPGIQEAQLLPYHDFGTGKSRNIGRQPSVFPVPSREEKEEWEAWFSQSGAAGAKRVRLAG